MPSRKNRQPPRQRPVKRLLDELLPRKPAKKAKIITRQLDTDEDSAAEYSNEVISTSSTALKRYEEVKKDRGTLPDPTLQQVQLCFSNLQPQQQQQQQQKSAQGLRPVTANSEFFYTPIYRRYFGLTPPNPQLYNRRLLEDYIDWYMNVYLEEEELPWQWISVGDPAERKRQAEQEAKRLSSISPRSEQK